MLILLAAVVIVLALAVLVLAWGREIGPEIEDERFTDPSARGRRVA